MDDINFDELDKAVNSVLQKPSSAPSQDADFVADTSSPEATAQEGPDAVQAVDTVQPIVPRKRGQFMDMVHPSSDMTTTGFSAQRPTFATRQTGSLQPLDPAVVEAVPQPQPVIDTPAEELTTDSVPDEEPGAQITPNIEEAKQAEWPDPLDGLDETDQDAQNPPEVDYEAQGQVAHVEADFVSNNEDDSEDASQNSPFIDGTEIEKRPLGAFTEATKDEVADPEDPSPAVVPEPLPEELAPEVVSVESDEQVAPSAADLEQQTMNQEGMSASIPQQYRAAEEPADNDQNEGHPVFDTKEYHQPLALPAKRSKTSRVGRYLLAIFFIIVFGVAAGYVIWAFKLL